MKKRIHDTTTGHDMTRRGVLRTAAWGAFALGAGSMRVQATEASGSVLSTDITGDAALAQALRPHLAGSRRVAVALIEPAHPVRFAGCGADEHTEFEIGSIAKTLTGALLMDAVNDGVLTLDTTVQDILGHGAAGSAIADVRLFELATHTSGLPEVGAPVAARMQADTLHHENPYAPYTPEETIRQALDAPVPDRGGIHYSNLGVSLQGHLVAIALGRPWPVLLSERVLDPLGLHHTWNPGTEAELYGRTHGNPTTGTDAQGVPVAPWACTGYAPAGMLRSTAADLACYLAYLIETPDPAAAGLSPLVRDPSNQTGFAVNWRMSFADGADDPVHLHGGSTAGFTCICAFRRGAGRGIVALSASAGRREELQQLARQAMRGAFSA